MFTVPGLTQGQSSFLAAHGCQQGNCNCSSSTLQMTVMVLKRHLLWALLCSGISLHCEGSQVLDLSNKHLQSIPVREANSTVMTLFLNGNIISLKESDRLALESYSKLTQLYLDNNIVSTIKAHYFTGLSHLKVLSLSGNRISRLDPDAFSGLEVLTSLDLSNNSLTIYPYELQNRVHTLQTLRAEGNPWNCSCELMYSIPGPAEETHFTLKDVNATCASPHSVLGQNLVDATTRCFLKTATSTTKEPSAKTSTILQPPLTIQSNGSRDEDQPAMQSNSWKFTVSVGALGLATAALIVCAIKGPSWYKLFHNYRHRRLREPPTNTTEFHQTPRQQHTYTFEKESESHRRTEEDEEEDGYYEDPYIRRED